MNTAYGNDRTLYTVLPIEGEGGEGKAVSSFNLVRFMYRVWFALRIIQLVFARCPGMYVWVWWYASNCPTAQSGQESVAPYPIK